MAFATVPAPGTTSWPQRNVCPFEVSCEADAKYRALNGSVWKYVPLSPAGSSPSRFTSDAM